MAKRTQVQETAAAFNKENYDNILVRVPKGTKAVWQDAADKADMKLNRWIVNAVTAYMDGDETGISGYGSAILGELSSEAVAFVQKNQSIYHSIMAMVAREKTAEVTDEEINKYMKRSGTKKFGLTDDDRQHVAEIMALCIKRRGE